MTMAKYQTSLSHNDSHKSVRSGVRAASTIHQGD